MKFETLKDSLNKGKQFVRYQETDAGIVEGKFVRSVYLRVLSVEEGVHNKKWAGRCHPLGWRRNAHNI